MGAVYLIRHGQASFGSSNYDVLSARGVAQAALAGKHMAATEGDMDIWVSGTLERQKDTAQYAQQAFGAPGELWQEAGFNEFDHEKVTSRLLPELAANNPLVAAFLRGEIDRKEHFQQVFEAVVDAWTAADHWDDLESWPQFQARVLTAFERILEQAGAGKRIAIVTSGGPITAIVAHLLQLSATKAFQLNWSIVNSSITKILYQASINRERDVQRRRSLVYFNNYSHLQIAESHPEHSPWVTHR